MKVTKSHLTFAAVIGLAALAAFAIAGHPVVDPSVLAALGVVPMFVGETADLKGEVLNAIKKHSEELSAAIAKTDAELKAVGQVSDATKNEIKAMSEKGAALELRLASVEQLAVSHKATTEQKKSLGTRFVESDEYKSFAGKKINRGANLGIELKDITSAAGSAGDGIWSYRDPEIVRAPYRPRMIRSLIPTVPVNSNLVEWVQQNSRTNNAAAVSEGAKKPKSDLTYDRKETPIRKIAHYFKVSMEALQDFARLAAEIDTDGMEMLKQEEEDQLLSGDGTGVNVLGLIPQATAYDTARTQTGDTQVDVIRRAILQVRQSYYGATGIVMNPADWQDIELLKDGENRYLFSAATSGAPARLWGLPVVESDSLPAGEFMVGAFATAATIYDRMIAAMFISTENEDDFLKNMASILFEERIALAVKRPLAFVHGNVSGAA